MFRKSRKIFYLILYHQPQRALNPLISHRLPPYADTLSSDRHSPLFRRSSAKVLTIQHFGTKHLPKYRRYSQKDQFVCRPYAPLRSQAADDLKLIDQAYANSARICRYFLTISKIICAAFRIAHRNTADDIFITTEMSAFRQTFFQKGLNICISADDIIIKPHHLPPGASINSCSSRLVVKLLLTGAGLLLLNPRKTVIKKTKSETFLPPILFL